MSLIGSKGDRALNESPDASALAADNEVDIDPEEAVLVSKALADKANFFIDTLQDANEAAIHEVAESVNTLIRTNSLAR